MKKLLYIFVCYLIFNNFLFSQIKNVAVLNLEGRGISDIEAATLTNSLIYELFKTGQFKVMERAKLDQILKEQGFQQTGCTTAECAVEIGKLVGVDNVITGSIIRIGKTYTLSIKMINVRTGDIIKTVDENAESQIENLILTSIPNVATKLSGVSTSEQKQLEISTPTEILPPSEKILRVATLHVESIPDGAKLYFNDKYVGLTPITLYDVPCESKSHRIRLEKNGYETFTTGYYLATSDVGKEKSVTFKMTDSVSKSKNFDIFACLAKDLVDNCLSPKGACILK